MKTKNETATKKVEEYITKVIRSNQSSSEGVLVTPEIARIFLKSYVLSNFHVGNIKQGHTEDDLFRVMKNKMTITDMQTRSNTLKVWDVDSDSCDNSVENIQANLKSLSSILCYDNGLIVSTFDAKHYYGHELMLTYIARHIFYMVKEGLGDDINTTGCHGYIDVYKRALPIFRYFNERVISKVTRHKHGIGEWCSSKTMYPSVLKKLLIKNVMTKGRRQWEEEDMKDINEFLDDLHLLAEWISGYVLNDTTSVEFDFASCDFDGSPVEAEFKYLLGSKRRLFWAWNYERSGRPFDIANYL